MDQEPPTFFMAADGRRIAHRYRPGRLPAVVFLCGLKSDMSGTKARYLDAFCRHRGQAYLRFDYTGHGQSSGQFVDGTIGHWARDARDVVAAVTQGPLVPVGSSMGGWVMCLLARWMPERIAGLVGVAAAPDFTADIPARLSDDERQTLARDGVVYVPSHYDDAPHPLTQAFLDDGARHAVLGTPLMLDCRVRLLHGTADPDVPWQTSLRLLETIAAPDIRLTLFGNAGHRLSGPAELDAIARAIDEVLS